MNAEPKELKIMIIGSSGSGKTSFVQRWTKNRFSNDYKATVISDFGFKIFRYNNNLYRIQLWDIGGQDKSTSMAKIFARDSYGCIVVTDISINETPREIFNWKEIIRQESSFIDNEAIPFILIGNKIDLIEKEEERAIIDDRTKNICQNYGFLNYFLTSAKEGINVNESMKFLLEYIIDRMNKFSRENNVEFGQKRKDTIKLTKECHAIRRDRKSKFC
jgi:small GTP-binding protein